MLIEPDAKDIGQASTRLAKAKGVDVLAMVETTEQISFLVDGLPCHFST